MELFELNKTHEINEIQDMVNDAIDKSGENAIKYKGKSYQTLIEGLADLVYDELMQTIEEYVEEGEIISKDGDPTLYYIGYLPKTDEFVASIKFYLVDEESNNKKYFTQTSVIDGSNMKIKKTKVNEYEINQMFKIANDPSYGPVIDLYL